MNVMATTSEEDGDDDKDGPALTGSTIRDGGEPRIVETSDKSTNAAVENGITFKQFAAGAAAGSSAYQGEITLKDNEGEVLKEIEMKSDGSSSAAKKKTFTFIEQEMEDVDRGREAEQSKVDSPFYFILCSLFA